MADNSSDKAAEFATIQSINLARLEAGEVKAVIALLEGLSGDLVGVLEKNKGSIEKQQKIATVKAAADKTIAAHYAEIAKKNQETLEGVAANQSKAAAEQVNAAIGGGAFGGVKVFDPVLDAQQWNQLAKKTTVFGHSSRHWWEGQKVDLQDKFIAQIRQGYALGEDVETLSRRIRGTKANSYKDGVMNVKKHEAAALVRSSVQTISNEARMTSFTKMKPAVKGIEWTATLDSRTTPVCRALDGKQWTLDKKPVGHDKNFPGATAHWNCRSTQIPVLASWQELSGKKIPAIGTATLQAKVNEKLAEKGWSKDKIAKATVRARASQDGQVSSNKDFDSWLMGKPKEFQRKLLGPTRAELWWKNDLTMADLVDQSGRPLTIQQLEEAIAAGELPAETEGTKFEPLPPGAVEPYTDPDKAVKLQTRAVAKLEEIINNPKGQTVLAGYVKKVMTENPDLSPAEQLAKAEALTAEKKLQSQKTSALAKAKKKILDGKEPTPGQQKFIDGLDPAEAAAFWEAIEDAQQADTGKLLEKGLSAIDEQGVVQGDDKFKKDLFEKLDNDQKAQLTTAMTQKKQIWQEGQKNALEEQINLLGDAGASFDPLEGMLKVPATKQAFEALPPEMQKKLQQVNDAAKLKVANESAASLKSDLENILNAEPEPLEKLFQNSQSKQIFDKLPPDLQEDVKKTASFVKANKQATDTIGELAKDPLGKKALAQAKQKLGGTPSQIDLAGQAGFEKNKLLIEDMAEQALTAKNKSAMTKGLEDQIPGLNVKDYSSPAELAAALENKIDFDDAAELHAGQAQIAKQIQETKNKSSALTKAKKKLANGEKPTPGQQKIIDGLDADEKAAFAQQVEDAAYKAAVEKAKPPGAADDWFDQFLNAGKTPQGTKPKPSDPQLQQKPAVSAKPKPVGDTGPTQLEIASVSQLQKIKDLSGSTRPYLAKDPATGKQYVVKTTDRGLDPAHLKSEAISDAVYRAAGARVPASTVVTEGGKTYKVAEFIEGGDTLQGWKAGKSKAEIDAVFADARQNFVADALFANWDAAGASFDNMFVADGKLYRIDNGGGLGWRAQGGEKSSFFAASGEITELKTLRDPGTAPIMSQIMKGISSQEINDQIGTLLDRRSGIMAAAADLPKRDRDALARRFDWLEGQLPAKARKLKPTPTRQTAAQIPADYSKRLDLGREGAGASVWAGNDEFEDQQLRTWRERDPSGQLLLKVSADMTIQGDQRFRNALEQAGIETGIKEPKSMAGIQQQEPPGLKDEFWQHLEAGAKTIGQHAEDKGFNDVTLSKFDKAFADLKAMKGSKDPAEQDMVKHYLPLFEGVSKVDKEASAKDIQAALKKSWVEKFKYDPSKYPKPKNKPRNEGLAKRWKGWEVTRPDTARYTLKTVGSDGTLADTDQLNDLKGSPTASKTGMVFKLRKGDVEITYEGFRPDRAMQHRNFQGSIRVNVLHGGDDEAALQTALDAIDDLGFKSSEPTDAQKELLYLHKGLTLRKDEGLAGYRNALAAGKTDEEKVEKVKAFAEKLYNVKLPRSRDEWGEDYNPEGTLPRNGTGARTWQRWDLTKAEIDKITNSNVLFHSGDIMGALEGWVKNGGNATTTQDRVRQGIHVGYKGASPDQDMDYGGGNFLYASNTTKSSARRSTGYLFKGRNLARIDIRSDQGDSYGRWERESGREGDLRKMVKRTQVDISANTGLMKNGISIFDEIDLLVVGTSQQQADAIARLKSLGLNEWPDGRKLEEVVVTR